MQHASPTAPRLFTPDEWLERLRWRYATKRFDPAAKLDASTWRALEESLRLAPSSFGLQPWRFVVVTDPARKAELRAASFDQPQIVECSHLVVFAQRKGLSAADVSRYVDRIAAERKVARSSLAAFEKTMLDFVARPRAERELDHWSARQVYLALGVFLSSAAALGVDACPMEGFEPARYDAILGLSAQGYGTAVVAAAGRRSAGDAYAERPKVRFAPADVIVHV